MLSFNAISQEKSGFRLAYNLSEVQGDFGLGFQAESPRFIHNSLTLKLRANQMFLNYDKGGMNDWTPYWTFGLGAGNNPIPLSNAVSIYGEGGVMLILPHSDFSASKEEWGGYGVFGFNFNISPSFCYFMEAGGIGSGATADRSDNHRIYSNGFIMQVGLKVHFGRAEKEEK